MTDLDPRIPTFRWAAVDRYRKAHIWLGAATACGIDMRWTLQTWKPEAEQMCPACRAYVQGWLDRHDHGSDPRPGAGVPVPLGYGSKTELPRRRPHRALTRAHTRKDTTTMTDRHNDETVARMYDAIEHARWQDLADALNRLTEWGADPLLALADKLGTSKIVALDPAEEHHAYRLRYRPPFGDERLADGGDGWIVEHRTHPAP